MYTSDEVETDVETVMGEKTISDILEAEVPQKYFLSKEQTEKIVFR